MSTTFADLGVSNTVATALAKRGIKSPFPVQQLVIEDVLDGHDVLVQSPTGSGKTLAFGVPLVDRIAADARRPAALVLAPTRELARQIVDELEMIARARALKVEVVYGGVGMEPQIRKAPKAHILVATPGRLEDLIQRRALTLKNIQTLVLDEADRMLDMGFKPAVDRIVAHGAAATARRSSSPPRSKAQPAISPRPTPATPAVTSTPRSSDRAAITHRFVQTPSQAAKVDELVDELDSARAGPDARLRAHQARLRPPRQEARRRATSSSVAMHGDKSQSQRQKALARFERGEVTVLIATDVAARGIDVSEITHVINFDAPEDADTYTHRTGRTGRAGATGEAVTFILGDQVHDLRRMAADLRLVQRVRHPQGRRAGKPSPAVPAVRRQPRRRQRPLRRRQPRRRQPQHGGVATATSSQSSARPSRAAAARPARRAQAPPQAGLAQLLAGGRVARLELLLVLELDGDLLGRRLAAVGRELDLWLDRQLALLLQLLLQLALRLDVELNLRCLRRLGRVVASESPESFSEPAPGTLTVSFAVPFFLFILAVADLELVRGDVRSARSGVE